MASGSAPFSSASRTCSMSPACNVMTCENKALLNHIMSVTPELSQALTQQRPAVTCWAMLGQSVVLCVCIMRILHTRFDAGAKLLESRIAHAHHLHVHQTNFYLEQLCIQTPRCGCAPGQHISKADCVMQPAMAKRSMHA